MQSNAPGTAELRRHLDAMFEQAARSIRKGSRH